MVAAVILAALIGCAIGVLAAYLIYGDKMIVAIKTAVYCKEGYIWYTVAGKSFCAWAGG